MNDEPINHHGHERETKVFSDEYECPVCGSALELTDFAHRTRVGYEAPTVRCRDCEVGMERVD